MIIRMQMLSQGKDFSRAYKSKDFENILKEMNQFPNDSEDSKQ
jgi:hypothetical protein